MTERLLFYLMMPTPYLHLLSGLAKDDGPGGLRWSETGEAVETADGKTFVFVAQVALFLEGFARVRSLIHFGHVLHLLYYLVTKGRNHPEPFGGLHALFHRTGRRFHNAGALGGHLCAEVPAVAAPIDLDTLLRLLARPAPLAELSRQPGVSERAPLPPEAFEEKVGRALRQLSPGELEHWLRHGRGPVTRAAEQVARELDGARPRTLAGVLAALAQRPRFAGAVPYVGQLVSALTLPPRRLVRQELPTGGYADVGTHGHPEQILPSQFGLDDLEFLRRFADHELLYFRREEPHRQTREDLVLLLDQGVRTWGDVRLVLAAAVFAFGKGAARRNVSLRLAATSAGGALLDPLQVGDAALGELLEASDLSPHPGLALERVLAEKAEAGRDVVLLTHPRSLAEPDVAAAARSLRPGTRLFGVSVDETGAVQLAEVRHGVAVKLGQFQVDLSPGEQVRNRPPAPPAAAPAEPLAPWTGNPEPVPFPFRFGPQGRIDAIAFDYDGEWVVLGGQNGMLYAFRVDGTQSEVLPRVLLNGGAFLQRFDALLGVAGGVVAAGWIGQRLVAVHYDFSRRQCRCYLLGDSSALFPGGPPPTWQWFYFREPHAVVAVPQGIVAAPSADFSRGVDLATGENSAPAAAPNSRIGEACREAKKHVLPPPQLPISRGTNLTGGHHRTLRHDETTGTIHVENVDAAWKPVTPLADGRPIFRDVVLHQALCVGNLLVVASGLPGYVSRTLHLLQMPGGKPLGEFQQGEFFHQFALSGDGRLLARQTDQSRVEVRGPRDLARPRLVTAKGKFHPGCEVILGRDWLATRVGNWCHVLDWRTGELVISQPDLGEHGPLEGLAIARQNRWRKAGGPPRLPPCVRYDPKRFLGAALFDLFVVVDAYGQLAVFSFSEELLCMFFLFRSQVAGWMPDGTRFGPPSMSQGPETPEALKKIGHALREAGDTRRGESAANVV